jgi:hypothetical protein
MAYGLGKMRAAAPAIVAAALVVACGAPSVSSMNCDRIGQEATRISQDQTLKITNLANMREVSRTDSEARCQATATFSNGASAPLNIRALQNAEGTRVEYSTSPFDGAQGAPPAQQQATPPPAQGAPGYDTPAQPPADQSQQ